MYITEVSLVFRFGGGDSDKNPESGCSHQVAQESKAIIGIQGHAPRENFHELCLKFREPVNDVFLGILGDLMNSSQQVHRVSCKLTESSQRVVSVSHLVSSL